MLLCFDACSAHLAFSLHIMVKPTRNNTLLSCNAGDGRHLLPDRRRLLCLPCRPFLAQCGRRRGELESYDAPDPSSASATGGDSDITPTRRRRGAEPPCTYRLRDRRGYCTDFRAPILARNGRARVAGYNSGNWASRGMRPSLSKKAEQRSFGTSGSGGDLKFRVPWAGREWLCAQHQHTLSAGMREARRPPVVDAAAATILLSSRWKMASCQPLHNCRPYHLWCWMTGFTRAHGHDRSALHCKRYTPPSTIVEEKDTRAGNYFEGRAECSRDHTEGGAR